MAAGALVQTCIDAEPDARATAVLDNMGLTVSDAVRMLPARIAREGALPFDFATDPAANDAWYRAKVREARDDPRPPIPHEEARAPFAERRAAAMRTIDKGGVELAWSALALADRNESKSCYRQRCVWRRFSRIL